MLADDVARLCRRSACPSSFDAQFSPTVREIPQTQSGMSCVSHGGRSFMAVLLIIPVCIALNAILAALEVAFVSASRTDLRARAATGDRRLRQLLALRETPERTLSAIQIAITLVSILSGAAAGAGAQELLGPLLRDRYGFGSAAANAMAIAVVSIPVMLATVVIGELLPKVLALRHAEHIALAGARLLYVLEQVFLPVVGALTFLAAGERDWRTLVRPAVTVGPDEPLLRVLRPAPPKPYGDRAGARGCADWGSDAGGHPRGSTGRPLR
jgi:hypothetical protein